MKQLRVVCAFVLLLGSIALAQTNPVPVVYQPLIPMTIKPASNGFTLTVNGFGFATGAVVLWNGSTRMTNYISRSQLQIQVNTADVAKPGTATVSVANPGPGGGTSNIVFFPVQTPTPSVVMFRAPGFSGSGVDVEGDFDNDGLPDLAVANGTSGSFFIDTYIGKGDGTFDAPFPNHSVTPVASMITGDFNGDGLLDLAVLDGVGNATTFLNHAFGSLPHGGIFIQQQSTRSWNDGAVTADFNGDGKLDLVVTGPHSSIRLGNGDGTFGNPVFIGPQGFAFSSGIPAVGDFDGDGKLDLAIPDVRDEGVIVLLGNGDGTFHDPGFYETQMFGAPSVAVADINGDGKLDIVTGGVSVLLGNGDGTFRNGVGVNAEGNGGPVNIGDFNGDGKLDLAISGLGGIQLLLGNGDGTFQNPILVAHGNSASVVMGDFNGDGKLGLVGQSLYLQVPVGVSPSSLHFGSRKVGTKSPPALVSLTNAGKSSLIIHQISIKGANAGDFSQTNNCGSEVPVGRSCTIKVIFAPQMKGHRVASLRISDNSGGSPQKVSLAGNGT